MRPIAFYLPQFYPTPENDKWWSPGFTEWTNVAKAKPLFPGHYQPRIPADLSFYDLRVPSVREQQAELARQAGIYGFCYWHYWFNGRRLLDKVFTEVVESGKPDYPFCLCWANHSWHKKGWSAEQKDEMLIEQTYPGREDYVAHFMALLPAFQDERYIKVDGKLLFGVYEPTWVPDTELFFDTWNTLAQQYNLPGFLFFGFVQGEAKLDKCIEKGYDKVVYDCLMDVYTDYDKLAPRKDYLVSRLKRKLLKCPIPVEYSTYADYAKSFFEKNPSFIPCVDPDFDHSPRSGGKWLIMNGSTPEKWGELCGAVKRTLDNRNDELLFIKSWNEWGEGNYLEPDMRWGRSYLDVLSKILR